MEKDKTGNEVKLKRPPRAQLTREEVIERIKKFPERKEQFLATAPTKKS